MTKEEVMEEFYVLEKDARNGYTYLMDEFNYVKFIYEEEGKILNSNLENDDLYGNDNLIDEEYEAEFSNGEIGYIPKLKVDKKEEFFIKLTEYVNCQLKLYDFSKAINIYGKKTVY